MESRPYASTTSALWSRASPDARWKKYRRSPVAVGWNTEVSTPSGIREIASARIPRRVPRPIPIDGVLTAT